MSSKSRALWWVLPALSMGCLQDYDQFDFGAGGAGATSAGGAGPTTGATGATGTTGSTPASTTATGTNTTSTTTTTTTTTATTTTGMGGMGPTLEVACYGDTCDVTGGERCCAENAAMGMCVAGSCSGGDVPITCDEQADCPGQICCVLKAGGNTNAVQCANDCVGSNADPLCSGADPCQFGTCVPNGDLPPGYMNCD